MDNQNIMKAMEILANQSISNIQRLLLANLTAYTNREGKIVVSQKSLNLLEQVEAQLGLLNVVFTATGLINTQITAITSEQLENATQSAINMAQRFQSFNNTSISNATTVSSEDTPW